MMKTVNNASSCQFEARNTLFEVVRYYHDTIIQALYGVYQGEMGVIQWTRYIFFISRPGGLTHEKV